MVNFLCVVFTFVGCRVSGVIFRRNEIVTRGTPVQRRSQQAWLQRLWVNRFFGCFVFTLLKMATKELRIHLQGIS